MSDDEAMSEVYPCGFDSSLRPEPTDNITMPDTGLRQHFLHNVASSFDDHATHPEYTINAQQLYGIRTDKAFLCPTLTVPEPTISTGLPYLKNRDGVKSKAKIDRKKFNQFIADFVAQAEVQDKADTVILLVDNRPFDTLVKKYPWAKHCATRMVQRSKLMIKERTMVAFCHIGESSGLGRVNPCFLTPIVLAALRALPHLDHVNLVGSDLDIYQNGVMDVEQQVNFMMPVLKRYLRVLEEVEPTIGMFWFSEVRLQNNAGRLVCPAVSSELQADLPPLNADMVGKAIDAARKGLWETRMSLRELLAKLKQQVETEAAYTLMGTRIAMMRGLGKTPLREVAPETPAQLLALLAIMCETFAFLCFPWIGVWSHYSMKTPDLDWMTVGKS